MGSICMSDSSSAAAEYFDRRRIWREKYAIRACYRGWLERMRPFTVPGPSLEVGAGAGDFKSLWPGLLSSDVVATPFVDFAGDALRLPIANGALGNIVVIDLLHHLRDPHIFLREASRVLKAGGRLLAVEPYITPLSFFGYRALHHESVYFGDYQRSVEKSDPWEGNLALPNLLFGRDRARWHELHPNLKIIHRRKFSLLDFQLACGFKPYSLVKSERLYDLALKVDRKLDVLGALWGFRIFCVIEKT
jgi:SAM-dependent methyltransferase